MDDEMTVEQYLTRHNEGIMNGLRSHGLELMLKLRNEYETNAAQVRRQLSETLHEKPLVVTLKCVGGPHIGQRFRLEPTAKEDVFKVGRSTGRHFKEKGVSLYKDKEISTTHAKIELRHGQVFLVDVRSTNGSLLNGTLIESQVPFRLQEGDLLTFGNTELKVSIVEAGTTNANPVNENAPPPLPTA